MLGVSVIFSCKKARENTNTQTAADNAICEGEFMRMLPATNSIAVKTTGNGVGRVEANGYPKVTIDTNNGKWPHTMTIDYGPAPGVIDSSDGKTRSGILVISFSNYWHTNAATATMNVGAGSTYIVNGVSFQGVVTMTHNSKTSFSISVANAKCTSGYWSITYNANRTYTWVSGYNDTIPSNDVFTITGNASGTDRNGLSYTMNITSPLYKTGSCTCITQGTINYTISGGTGCILDFGNGSCDNQATVTINGNSFPITL